MDSEKHFLFKILIAISIILVTISVFLPWATVESSSPSESRYMEFYSWGIFLSSSIPSPDNTQFIPYFFYLTMILNEGTDLDTDSAQHSSMFVTSLFLACIILPFLILSIIASLYLIFTFDKENYELIIGSSAIYFTSLVFFYVLIQYGFIGTFGKPSKLILAYSSGFYFVILSIVLLVSCYVVIRYLSMRNLEKTDSLRNPLEVLKNRYAEGEITKEEFDSIKKDIEGEHE